MTKCSRSGNFRKNGLKSTVFKLQKWFKYKNGVELNFQSSSALVGTYFEHFPLHIALLSRAVFLNCCSTVQGSFPLALLGAIFEHSPLTAALQPLLSRAVFHLHSLGWIFFKLLPYCPGKLLTKLFGVDSEHFPLNVTLLSRPFFHLHYYQ